MSSFDRAVKDLVDVIQESAKSGTSPIDTQAKVVRVDEEQGVVWVHIPGGVDETPVAMTMNAVAGDQVKIRIAGGNAWITGNISAPPTDDTTARKAIDYAGVANRAAASAVQSAGEASEAAASAKATAEGVSDIAQQARTDASTAKTAATSAQQSAESARVGLATVEDVVGVLNWITAHGTMTSQYGGTFVDGQVYFVQDDTTPGDYHVGQHYYSVVAEPKADDIDTYYVLSVSETVQNYVTTHVYVDNEGLWLIPESNTTPASSGKKILIATGAGSTYTIAGTYIIEKVNGIDTVLAQFTVDESVIGDKSSGTYMSITAESQEVYSKIGNSPQRLVRVGRKTTPTGSLVKYVFGITSNQYHSDSEGHLSFTEGYNCACSGDYSHAEGYDSLASGESAHAEGGSTKAIGDSSHAGGLGTITEYDFQTAIGKFNDNQSDNAFEIGNGTNDNNRSNAFAVGWNGHVKTQGKMTVGEQPSANMDVATKKYVDDRTVDYIIERGWASSTGSSPSPSSNPSFYYVKYNNGVIEAWADVAYSSNAGSQWTGSPGNAYYYRDLTINTPSIFQTLTNAVVVSANTQWWVFGTWRDGTKIKCRITKFVSSSQASGLRIHAIGTWK